MELKENKARESERSKMKQTLNLPKEEHILFMAERSWLFFWPVALGSLIFLVSSATITSGAAPAVLSFGCLIIGLLGLLLMATMKGQERYYLTNFRVLVRRRSLLGGAPRWSAMPYPSVRRCSLHYSFARGRLILEGERERGRDSDDQRSRPRPTRKCPGDSRRRQAVSGRHDHRVAHLGHIVLERRAQTTLVITRP